MHALEFHPNAMIAAQAALAAQAQGKFLEMHKKLLANSTQLSRDNILAWAKELNLNVEQFTKDLDSDAIKARIQKEGAEAVNIGASGTPASFVNGRYVSGAKPYQSWKDMVDEELKWAKDGNRPKFTIGKNVSETQPKSAAQPSGPDPNKAYTIALGTAPVVGNPKAKVLIQHYLDYQ
jgi:protein-disulfide isomerase